jgi:hypothetical protein
MIWWFILGILTLLVSFIGLFVHKTSNHADIKHTGCDLIREAFNKVRQKCFSSYCGFR